MKLLDSDFHQLSFLFGPPPKVVWIRTGNCSTTDLVALVRIRAGDIKAFGADPEAAFLVVEA